MSAVKKQVPEVPNIFAYHDYRLFLKDWFRYLKEDKQVSMRKLAVVSGLAVGYLPMVLSGKRALSEKSIKQLEPYLNLSIKETLFLTHLVELNEATDAASMVATYNKIKQFIQYKNQHFNEIEAHRLLSAWHYVAIRELVNINGFKLDAKWIQKRLVKKVSVTEIKKAVQFLLESKYIDIDKKGRPFLPEKGIQCDGGVFKISMANFHREMLEVAAESIHNTDREIRKLITHTMAIEANQFDEVNSILNEAINKIQKLGDKTKRPERVYQVSLLAFPLSKEDEVEDDEK